MDRKPGKKPKGVQKRVGIRQETRKTVKRSPKAGQYWTGNPEKSRKESKSRSVLDRKRGKKSKGVQKRVGIGQETRKTAKRSPKAGPYWTGNKENS
ncbi:hypothetical protein ACE38V_17590 [Cytobacillus sp. Hz8]|uniref:hypothetical protein n=1 Tax=Cytobacillus sp. Hz8 TaxID=3347168 RepID=UPI0035DA7D5C